MRAVLAAGRLKDPRTIRDLTKLLAKPEVELREAAAWALSNLKHPGVVRPLTKALQYPKIGVEIYACLGLGRQTRPPLALLERIAKMENRRAEVRAACAFALGLSGNPKAGPALVGLLDEERPEIVLKVAGALGLLGAPAQLGVLAREFWGRRGEVQSALAWALSRAAQGKR